MIIPITPAQARNVTEVQVRIGKAYFTGRVTGKNNKFATVLVRVPIEGADTSTTISMQYTWDAIAHHINSGNPLIG